MQLTSCAGPVQAARLNHARRLRLRQRCAVPKLGSPRWDLDVAGCILDLTQTASVGRAGPAPCFEWRRLRHRRGSACTGMSAPLAHAISRRQAIHIICKRIQTGSAHVWSAERSWTQLCSRSCQFARFPPLTVRATIPTDASDTNTAAARAAAPTARAAVAAPPLVLPPVSRPSAAAGCSTSSPRGRPAGHPESGAWTTSCAACCWGAAGEGRLGL